MATKRDDESIEAMVARLAQTLEKERADHTQALRLCVDLTDQLERAREEIKLLRDQLRAAERKLPS